MRVTRTGEIVAVVEYSETVTKVTTLIRRLSWLALMTFACNALAQLNPQIPGANAEMPSGFTTSITQSPAIASGTQAVGKPGPAGVLYDQLRDVGLDPHRVYSIRDASLDHDSLHISLDDGTIAFTYDVLGKITGAFFEGEGEVLLSPPDQGERISLSLFTGAAILEEKFTSAYLRFNDDLAAELAPTLRLEQGDQAFATRNDAAARLLAQSDALRLLISFSRMLPVSPNAGTPVAFTGKDHFLHARVVGSKLGIFDLFYDSTLSEQISVGQIATEEGVSYYNSWASFSDRPNLKNSNTQSTEAEQGAPADNEVRVSSYKIRATIRPPHEISADALVDLQIREGGDRTLLFELSRFLDVKSVDVDGTPVEFIHNPSVEGTERARRGNDLMVVVFPAPLRPHQHLQLRFVYSGSVLSAAGSGLLYVGARGTWYPNRGIAMADFDLQFSYPLGWTLVATGKRVPPATDSNAQKAAALGEEVSHWISEKPIPVAGFNLGRYTKGTAKAGNTEVASYATSGVENKFPQMDASVVPNITRDDSTPLPTLHQSPTIIAPTPPSPARHAQEVADRSAAAINFLSSMLGPYPYSKLALTQLPGPASQGWPGLVFLSSYVFLSPQDRAGLHLSRADEILYGQSMLVHETAHQWWGDQVAWHSYRDQWMEEALANYCAMLKLEQERPADFTTVMEQYRRDLFTKDKAGQYLKDAGPVTLGVRLSSSRFPSGYSAIAYGRGTWLLHMLRTMLADAEVLQQKQSKPRSTAQPPTEPFVRALRNLQRTLAQGELTERALQSAFEAELPRSLWYENRKSLDWFFDGWVNGTAVPVLELHDLRIGIKGGNTEVSGSIRQKEAPSNLVTSVPIYAVEGRGNYVLLGRVFADGSETQFHLNAPRGTKKVALDPYQTLLTALR